MNEEALRAGFDRLGWVWDPERGVSPDQEKVISLGLEQPLTTLVMKAPQILAVNYGWTHNKHILALDKGMGKTVTYLTAAFRGAPEYVVIACPTNAMAAQRREILAHFPFYADRFTFVRGQAAQRYKQWRTPNVRVFITTTATLQSDIGGRELTKGTGRNSQVIAPPWLLSTHLDHLGIDEFHKYLRRRSKTWEQLKKLKPETLILDSGSPVSGGPHDLWPALNLCDPKFWSSYWNYVKQFCLCDEGWGGKGQVPIGPKADVQPWRNAIAPYVFSRKKDPRDFPPKSRFFMDLDLPSWQRKLHDDLRNELFTMWSPDALHDGRPPKRDGDTAIGGMLIARNVGDAIYRARLSLICPQALDPSLPVGAGIEAIAEDAEDLEHFVLTTPFRAPIPFLKAYLESKGRRVWVLSGGLGIDPDRQDAIIDEFQRVGGVCIQTTKYATSYEFIRGPEHNYCLGYEHDPEDNKQAEDRMQRLSSTRPSFHWYVRFAGTYDSDQMERIIMKGENIFQMMDKGKYWDPRALLDHEGF